MPKRGNFINDLSKLVMGAAGAAQGAQKELEVLLHQQIKKYVSSADWVPREEFDMVRETALQANEQAKTLAKKVASLEKQLAKQSKSKPPPKPKANTGRRSSTGKSAKK